MHETERKNMLHEEHFTSVNVDIMEVMPRTAAASLHSNHFIGMG